jgi:hypothetical protein
MPFWATRSEVDRLAMRASWEIHITCPGYRQPLPSGQLCSATVLSRDTAYEANYLQPGRRRSAIGGSGHVVLAGLGVVV